MRKGEAESLVVADGREEAGAAGKKILERRWQWRAAARLLLRAGEREGERASGGARLAAGERASAVMRTWWPTRVRPPRRMHATRRPNAVGVPRRRGAGAGEEVTRGRAGPASASGPEVRPRPVSAPLSLFHFLNSFSKKA